MIFFKGDKDSEDSGENMESGSFSDAVEEQIETYTFSALTAAIELGIPLRCSYTIGNTEVQGYVKGDQWRGKIRQEGEEGVAEVIMKDDCMWSWAERDERGMKMCFDTEDGESMWNQDEITDTGVQYICEPAAVNDDLFDPPSEVTFTDVWDMMESGM